MIGPTLLFCPGDRPERWAKAAAAADLVILDLEDAVAPDAKESARAAIVAALRSGEVDPGTTVVRINPADTAWGRADVEALRGTGVRTVMLPKAADPVALADVAQLLDADVLALCETAAGVLNAATLAAEPGCAGLMWGGEDLTADLGGRSSRRPTGEYLSHVVAARTAVLLAAGAHGKTAVDGVYLDVHDADGLAAETADAVAMGFAAKASIHPRQIPVIRDAFRPDDDALAWAREVVAAVADGGVATVRGRMVDEPLLRQAWTLLAAAGEEASR